MLIVYGDLVFEKQIFNFDFFHESFVITGNMQDDCIGTKVDEKGNACYFEYGLPNKWCQIAFITASDFEKFRSYAINKECAKLYTFEIFNKMIDKGYILKNIKRKGELIEIASIRDMERAIKISRGLLERQSQ